jgi:heme/copper-type cytochrome/quinol oxidase subunit 2
MEGIVDLHHDIMLFLVFIMVFVLYLLAIVIINFPDTNEAVDVHGYAGDSVSHNTPIEII